jgi:hypothetical protein
MLVREDELAGYIGSGLWLEEVKRRVPNDRSLTWHLSGERRSDTAGTSR